MLSGVPGVVAFAVAGRALDHRVVIGHTGRLVALRNAVDVGAERDHRLAAAPLGHPRGRDAGDAVLDGEAVVAQQLAQVALGLDLLEADLAEAEDHVVHLLAELEHRRRRDVGVEGGFQLGDPRVDGAAGAGAAAGGGAGAVGRWAWGTAASPIATAHRQCHRSGPHRCLRWADSTSRPSGHHHRHGWARVELRPNRNCARCGAGRSRAGRWSDTLACRDDQAPLPCLREP